ncbi:uncharacterized protein LOC120357565 [Solenopsis invicta]|uniref:uncharacterized protein LOC120357565 n=1 Tax=Solenopsis invicta TaxID=13686 RepID=UPI00193D0C73|nr:uncharacterized protein LOC120357565 [Solenopsis invicta]
MGSKIVSPEHVKKLIKQFSKDKHLLCDSDLEPKDKMNFDAVEKLCAPRVTELLSAIPDSQSTKQFLILIKHILNSFLNKKLKIEERIYSMWHATFFLRLWRRWLQENNYSIDKNFITSNAYTSIELNAHGLLILIEKIISLHLGYVAINHVKKFSDK